MKFDLSYKSCTKSVKAGVKVKWEVFINLETANERLVYLFITQPKVRYVSVYSIAFALNISPKEVMVAMLNILTKGV